MLVAIGLVAVIGLLHHSNGNLRMAINSAQIKLQIVETNAKIATLEARLTKEQGMVRPPNDANVAEVPSAPSKPQVEDPNKRPVEPAEDPLNPRLPNCSVVFFHHLEKTAGTTLRSVLQRNAQLGHFDFFSFINRFNKLQFQMVTHRLDSLTRTPGGLTGLRLAVEIHIGGGGYEHFVKYTMPDLLLLRAKLRTAGCRCNLVTLLRHPLMAHISWHHHFVNHRVPLCFWNNPYDCQSRMSIALACHGGPSIRPLTPSHAKALEAMWSAFDLIGVTEFFDEFLVLLTKLVGLQARRPSSSHSIIVPSFTHRTTSPPHGRSLPTGVSSRLLRRPRRLRRRKSGLGARAPRSLTRHLAP